MRGISAAVSFVLLLCLTTQAAEDEVDYPHGEYEDDCVLCHRAEAWTPAEPGPEFRHEKYGFHLDGAHAQTACRTCHESLRFGEAEPDCVSCHLDVHQAELGTDCARCHNTRSFIDRSVMLRRHVATRFPLRGTHMAVDCGDCHPIVLQGRSQYVNTPTECDACHLDAYQTTTAPDHQAEGFSTDCSSCHTPTVWQQGRFNHALVSGACEDCHLDDYQRTTNPNHQASGFPTTCESCHRTTRWRDISGFDHDGLYFPIYSGRHRGRWSDCSDCHTVASNFSSFSCLGCHPHSDRQETDGHHREVGGYTYDSAACYSCHPRGNQ